MKIFIKTYGCQANISDSETIAGLLKKNNYTLTNSEAKADIIIVNSCSVKNSTQSSILNYIEKNKNKKLIIAGCLPKTLNLRNKFPNLLAILDTNSITKLPNIIKQPKDIFSDKKENRINLPKIRKNKDIAIIQIAEGCLGACTYCSAKLARGDLRSYKVKDIKKEFEKAIKEDCKKIYLTSQDNGCYGFDIGTNLPNLIKELLKIKGNYEIRIGMMNPMYLNKILKDLIPLYKDKRIKKFIHIPFQSGSDKIIKAMNRNYKINDFKKQVKVLRKNIPNISIATDVIVGYPLENESDFQKTLNLIKEIKPEVLNVSKFSSRQKTLASKLKQLPSEIIKERSVRISSLFS